MQCPFEIVNDREPPGDHPPPFVLRFVRELRLVPLAQVVEIGERAEQPRIGLVAARRVRFRGVARAGVNRR